MTGDDESRNEVAGGLGLVAAAKQEARAHGPRLPAWTREGVGPSPVGREEAMDISDVVARCPEPGP